MQKDQWHAVRISVMGKAVRLSQETESIPRESGPNSDIMIAVGPELLVPNRMPANNI